MLKAAWKSILGRKVRLLLSTVSIVLGIAFVSGSLIFTNLLASSLEGMFTGQFADVNVTAASGEQGLSTATPVTLEAAVIDEISAVDGVAEATGVVTSSAVYPMNSDGHLVAFEGAPGVGTNFQTSPAAGGIEGLHVERGRGPRTDEEIALDPGTLARGNFTIGSQLEVATPFDGIQTYQISGTASYTGGTAGATNLFFTLSEAQRLFVGGQDVFTGVWISTQSGADDELVAEQVGELLPDGFRAVTGAQLAADLEEQLGVGLGFVNVFLLVFAAIALVVAALLVLNTFSILVAQRTQELALLRALGATRTQVRNSVLFESIVVGAVGATIGIAAGWLLCWAIVGVLGWIGFDVGVAVPSLTPAAVLSSYALAIVITIVAALLPARRASRTRPVEAMTKAATTGEQTVNRWGVLGGIGLLEIGAAAIICGLWLAVPYPVGWVGIGSAAVLVGTVLAASVIGRPIVWLANRSYRRLFGEVGRMAALNAARQPRRTAATAATLMIGLALVTTVAILADSTTTSIRDGLTGDRRGDFIIAPVNYQPFDRAVADEVVDIDGVDQVWTYSRASTSIDGQALSLLSTSPEGLMEGSGIDVLQGQLAAEGNSVLVDRDVAENLGLRVGDTFEVPDLLGSMVELEVGGLFSPITGNGLNAQVVINEPTFQYFGDPKLVNQVQVLLSPGADQVAVRAGLEAATSEMPTVVVTDTDEYARAMSDRFGQLFSVIYGLLALAIVISVLGIMNTLSLSIQERTRELGLLRAVGMTRGQVARLITLESVIVAVMGSVLGIVLGLIFGSALAALLRDNGIQVLAIPWWQLLGFVILAVVLGWVAAILPARHAARLNVLGAIASP